MSVNEDEIEIKVEYYETFDLDPLHDNRDKTTENNLDMNSAVVVGHRNISKEAALESSVQNNKGVQVADKINAIKERELETLWYKLVTNSRKYVCKFCDRSYTTVQTLRNHVRLKHPSKYQEIKILTITGLRKKKLKCHICTKTFKNILDLGDHIQYHGLNNIQKSCPICHAFFESEMEVSNHVISEHKSLKKIQHTCFICGYSTSKLSHYKQHENTHLQDNKKKCPHCDYSTNYPSNLRIHERIHTNDKPYMCDNGECDYRCATKSALSSHQLKHDKEKNMLYCDKCSYSTVYKYSLKKHIDSHSRNSVRKRL
ncbi:unnamed protein product [Arctia plantaginis]|uniref:C2H2-type domain-containing protein n=1 Tax=Arctia plantaginis TaxID=874455 RepID=A0A8S1BCM3_ARCPL|nr:unnamed protein product [Arctia plantaginis]